MEFEDRSAFGQMFLHAEVPPPGTRVVVPNWEHLKVVVISCHPEPGATKIMLDWGQHGTSHVYLHDEGKTWNRLSNHN